MTKTVKANLTMYEHSMGRVEKGQEYVIEDEMADRWVRAGVATAVKAKARKPDPEPEPDDEDEESDDDSEEEASPPAEEDEAEDEPEEDPQQLAADAHKLHDDGLSERAIAHQMGISRTRVHTLLTA